MYLKLYFFLCAIVILQCCGNDRHIRVYRLPKTIELPQNQNIKSQSSDYNWEIPEGWIPSSGSSMRLASFDIPYEGGIGDLSLIELEGNGGGLESNINRWRRQLNLDTQPLFEIEKDLIKMNGKLGEYQVIKIVNIQNNSAFIVGIIPTHEGKTLFVKLSANPYGIQKSEPNFILFCSSINFSH